MKKGVLIIAFVFILLNVGSFVIAEVEEDYVISLPGNQIDANVWGRYIVYLEDLGNNKYDVYVYDSGLTVSKEDDIGVIKITKDGIIQQHSYSNPVIDGRYISWLDNKEDIYVYDMGEDGIISAIDAGTKRLLLSDTDPSEIYSYQKGTKENLKISSGVLVWQENEITGGDYDIRGYNLNVQGEANPLNPKDLHYLAIANEKGPNIAGQAYPINEREPYILGNSIAYVAEYYTDLGEFGVVQSDEVYKIRFSNEISEKTMISRDDGCTASEPSLYFNARQDIIQDIIDVVWINYCQDSRIMMENQEIKVAEDSTLKYYSPLWPITDLEILFYVEEKGEELFLVGINDLNTEFSRTSTTDRKIDIDDYRVVYNVQNNGKDIGIKSLQTALASFKTPECSSRADCPLDKTENYCDNLRSCSQTTKYSCLSSLCISFKERESCKICASGCEQGLCLGGTCDDKIKNGDESDIDCGGPFCEPCNIEKTCNKYGDCISNNCVKNKCTSNICPPKEEVPLFTASNKLYLNQPINSIKSVITKTELPFTLMVGKFNGVDYLQNIEIGNYPKTIFAREPSSNYDPSFVLGFSFTISNYLYNSIVLFSSPVSFLNSEEITLFGKNYKSALSSEGIILLENGKRLVLTNENPSKTYYSDYYKTIRITLISASDTSATIGVIIEKSTDIGGVGSGVAMEIQEELIKKVNGLFIRVVSADETNTGIYALVDIGTDIITLIDGSPVLVGRDQMVVDGTSVDIDGSINNVAKLTITVSAPNTNNDALRAGQNFVDPVFKTFKINYGLNINDDSSSREKIGIAKIDDNKMTLSFKDSRNKQLNNFQWAISPTASTIELQDSAGKNIVVLEGAQVYRNEYAVVGNQDEGRLIKVTNIINQAGYSNDRVKFTDVLSGEIYQATLTAEGVGTVTIAGKVFDVNYYGAPTISEDLRYVRINYPDSTGANAAVIYPTISTSKGAKVAFYKPLEINIKDWDGKGNSLNTLRFPNGNGYTDFNIPKSAGTTNIKVGKLDYRIIIDAALQNMEIRLMKNEIEGVGEVALIIFEERDNSVNYNALIIKLEPGNTAIDGIGVEGVIKTWRGDDNWFIGTNNNLLYAADLYGTIISLDTSDLDQKTATISYPDEQIYANILITNSNLCAISTKFIRADADNSGKLDLADALTILNNLFFAGKVTCQDSADVDDNGILNIADAIYLLQRLYSGGAAISAPNAAGEDPTQDNLNCNCYGTGC